MLHCSSKVSLGGSIQKMISLFLIEVKITLQEKTFAGLVCNSIIFDQCVLSIAILCLFASNLSK